MTTITTEKIIYKPTEIIKTFISDLKNFETWWDKYNAYYDCKNQILTFSPISFIHFQLRSLSTIDNNVKFEYLKTPFNGFGTWTLEEINNQSTKVSYTISITGNNFLVDKILNSMLFKWKHNKDILFLINKLNNL